jgi:hypothetical protein
LRFSGKVLKNAKIVGPGFMDLMIRSLGLMMTIAVEILA